MNNNAFDSGLMVQSIQSIQSSQYLTPSQRSIIDGAFGLFVFRFGCVRVECDVLISYY
jgi:hypothetical protein